VVITDGPLSDNTRSTKPEPSMPYESLRDRRRCHCVGPASGTACGYRDRRASLVMAGLSETDRCAYCQHTNTLCSKAYPNPLIPSEKTREDSVLASEGDLLYNILCCTLNSDIRVSRNSRTGQGSIRNKTERGGDSGWSRR
jgi:hypothetical protein